MELYCDDLFNDNQQLKCINDVHSKKVEELTANLKSTEKRLQETLKVLGIGKTYSQSGKDNESMSNSIIKLIPLFDDKTGSITTPQKTNNFASFHTATKKLNTTQKYSRKVEEYKETIDQDKIQRIMQINNLDQTSAAFDQLTQNLADEIGDN